MQIEEPPGGGNRLPDAVCECRLAHSVLHSQGTRFELLPDGTVRDLRRRGWRGASLLGECQVWIAASVCGKHVLITGQRRCDTEFLLAPVNIGETHSRFRAD